MRVVIVISLLMTCAMVPSAQESRSDPASGKPLDQVLDSYVRDGMVYYRALKAGRSRLDAYVGSLADASIASASHEEQLAFWLNGYNALVLRTVIDHYPISQRTRDYPAHSIRQIPGAFDRIEYRVARRRVTLDRIEQTILPEFHDPRVYLALGRGAVGSGRLRSEPFVGGALSRQLAEVAAECIGQSQCLDIDRGNNRVGASSIFSWRSKDFIAAYAGAAPALFAIRGPIERAVLAFAEPKLLAAEREFLARNQFSVVYKPFDWSLNDLTGRRGR